MMRAIGIVDRPFDHAESDIPSRFMPLSEAVTSLLQLDKTAALAAAVIIGGAHPEIIRWVGETVCGEVEPQPRPRAARRRARKANGHRKPRANGGDRRLAKREADDDALVAAMRRRD
jgi:hypothetical protein